MCVCVCAELWVIFNWTFFTDYLSLHVVVLLINNTLKSRWTLCFFHQLFFRLTLLNVLKLRWFTRLVLLFRLQCYASFFFTTSLRGITNSMQFFFLSNSNAQRIQFHGSMSTRHETFRIRIEMKKCGLGKVNCGTFFELHVAEIHHAPSSNKWKLCANMKNSSNFLILNHRFTIHYLFVSGANFPPKLPPTHSRRKSSRLWFTMGTKMSWLGWLGSMLELKHYLKCWFY